jgi:hypothetical protein
MGSKTRSLINRIIRESKRPKSPSDRPKEGWKGVFERIRSSGLRLSVGTYIHEGVPDALACVFPAVHEHGSDTVGVVWTESENFRNQVQALGLSLNDVRELQIFAETCVGADNDEDTQKRRMTRVLAWVKTRV